METTSTLQRIEILRSMDAEVVAATAEVLDEAGIPYSATKNTAVFDYMAMGRGHIPDDVILTVDQKDYDRARAAMEAVGDGSELPPGHYLLSISDEDLADMLSNPHGWNASDLAHARRLAMERSLDEVAISARKEERLKRARQGKPAPRYLLIWGVLAILLCALSPFWGLLGMGLGYSLAFMKDTTPDGVFPTYDAASRKKGLIIFWVSAVAFVAGAICYWILYRELAR